MWFAFLCIALLVIIVQGAEIVRLRRSDPWDLAWKAFERKNLRRRKPSPYQRTVSVEMRRR